MDFDTKIAIIVRDDLATWQKLNVTAFLTSGVTGADQSLFGEEPGCRGQQLFAVTDPADHRALGRRQ